MKNCKKILSLAMLMAASITISVSAGNLTISAKKRAEIEKIILKIGGGEKPTTAELNQLRDLNNAVDDDWKKRMMTQLEHEAEFDMSKLETSYTGGTSETPTTTTATTKTAPATPKYTGSTIQKTEPTTTAAVSAGNLTISAKKRAEIEKIIVKIGRGEEPTDAELNQLRDLKNAVPDDWKTRTMAQLEHEAEFDMNKLGTIYAEATYTGPEPTTTTEPKPSNKSSEISATIEKDLVGITDKMQRMDITEDEAYTAVGRELYDQKTKQIKKDGVRNYIRIIQTTYPDITKKELFSKTYDDTRAILKRFINPMVPSAWESYNKLMPKLKQEIDNQLSTKPISLSEIEAPKSEDLTLEGLGELIDIEPDWSDGNKIISFTSSFVDLKTRSLNNPKMLVQTMGTKTFFNPTWFDKGIKFLKSENYNDQKIKQTLNQTISLIYVNATNNALSDEEKNRTMQLIDSALSKTTAQKSQQQSVKLQPQEPGKAKSHSQQVAINVEQQKPAQKSETPNWSKYDIIILDIANFDSLCSVAFDNPAVAIQMIDGTVYFNSEWFNKGIELIKAENKNITHKQAHEKLYEAALLVYKKVLNSNMLFPDDKKKMIELIDAALKIF